jgi:ribosomal-protein-alanine acetyltransferase
VTVSIRKAVRRDLARILDIEQHCFGDGAWPTDLFEHYLEVCPSLFLVVRVGTAVAGYSITCFGRSGAEIASIAVSPRRQRRGLAARLLRTSIRRSKRLGIGTVWLMVRTDNHSAIAFYRKFGFVRTATVRGYYEDGSAAWRMRLTLS